MNILIVEDEIALAEAIDHILNKEGYVCDIAGDGQLALDYIYAGSYDLILLDIMLPRLDGISVLRQIRSENIEIPVLMLTAKSSVADKVNGLNTGADDYLTKPFDKEELVARVRALTRRKGNLIFNEIVYEDLILDLNSICLRCKDREVGLSSKEFEIARIMLSEPKMTFSKDLLISRAWGFDSEVSDNNVEAYVSFLRKKLKYLGSKLTIKNIQKIGYRLEVLSWKHIVDVLLN